MYDAYARIFERCGLKAFAVEADTGVIGGKFSHEFMVPAETGENEVVFCEACGYAANIEKATSGIPKTAAREVGAAIEKFATPGVVTIEALSKAPYKVPANRQIKTLVYIADSKPVIVLIRGDDQLNEAKLAGDIGTTVFRPATPRKFSPRWARIRAAWARCKRWSADPTGRSSLRCTEAETGISNFRRRTVAWRERHDDGRERRWFPFPQCFHGTRHQGDGVV